MKHILFDLDGTLLPMWLDEFSRAYMKSLSVRFLKYGIDAEKFAGYMWKSMYAMINNNGDKTNEEVFRECFSELIPIDFDVAQNEFMDYYEHDFDKLRDVTYPSKYAPKIIDACRQNGFDVILATNPIFPRCATLKRIAWAGMNPDDFAHITVYENSFHCKPNLDYYRDIIQMFGYDPEDCMMVGNDVAEDMVASRLGMKTYLVEGFVENKYNLPLAPDYKGSLKHLYEFFS